MYSTWKRAPEGPVNSAVAAANLQTQSRQTVQIPDAVHRSVAEGRWRLPAKLIRSPSENPPPAVSIASPSKTDHLKLSRGFELLFQLLGGSAGVCGPTVLSRVELTDAVTRLSEQLMMKRPDRQRLHRLVENLWTLLEGLQLPTAPSTTAKTRRLDSRDRLLSCDAVLEGLRKRVSSDAALLELKRSVLKLAADAFEVLAEAGAASVGDNGRKADGSTTEWTSYLIRTLAKAGLDPGRLRAAIAEAAALSGQADKREQFGELRRESWLRMVHAQFF